MKTIPLSLKQNIGVAIASIALFSSLPSYALTVQEVPNPRETTGGWVTDSANILSDSTEKQLNQIISQLESENGTEIAVVTVPETSPSASPKEFATELFNYWGIGKADRDNGVLFLISVSDRRTEIETGSGMQSILPDTEVANIIDTKIIPQFKQQNYDEGTLAGTKALIVNIKAAGDRELTITEIPPEQLTEISSDRNMSTADLGNLVCWILLFCSPLLVLYLILRNRKVYIRPDEVRKRIVGYGNRPVICTTCKQKMERLYKHQVDKELSKPEKIAQQIGSIEFEGWRCPKCSSQPVIIAYTASAFSRFKICHNCQELTITHTEITTKHPTRYGEGKRLLIDKCHCCGYYRETQRSIPRLPPPRPSHSSSNSSNNSDWIVGSMNNSSSSSNSYGGSSDSSSSSSGCSGGDFGGGSSGGGGAGGSW